MREFIEGAAYVSPSENRLYPTQTRSGTVGVIDQHGNFRVPGDNGIPEDLVLVWAPNDPLPDKDLPRADGADHSLLADIRYELDGFRQELGGIEYHMINSAHEQLKQLLIDDWHYPPRLNSRPGRYEDETGQEWRFHEQAGENVEFQALHWESGTTGNSWHMVPIDQFGERIAVKWIGELDE